MSMSSKHTKVSCKRIHLTYRNHILIPDFSQDKLEALHPNITCMRHPDHIGAKDTVEFWSHHEKVTLAPLHRT